MGPNAASLAHISSLKSQIGIQKQKNSKETGVYLSAMHECVTPAQMSYMSLSDLDLNTKDIYALKYKKMVPTRPYFFSFRSYNSFCKFQINLVS